MRHRVHDHLFAAAGVTAALSLIGTGVTVMHGSVLRFDAWPLVSGDQPRKVELPMAPIVATPAPVASQAQGQSVFGVPGNDVASLVRGGVPASLSAAIAAATPGSAGSGVGSVALTVPATQPVRPTVVPRVVGSTVKVEGIAGSLGSAGQSGQVDGDAAPVVVDPNVTGTTRNARGTTDADGDGVPDSWQLPHATPSDAAEQQAAQPEARDTPSAFRADPPVIEAPASSTDEPAPGTEPPATEEPVPGPVTDPVPTEPDVPSTDEPAPSTDPTPSDPAPPADSTPSDDAGSIDGTTTPSTDPAPADPAPPADSAPAPEPTPDASTDPAPVATPEPAPAPEPAPETAPVPAPESAPAPAPAPTSEPAAETSTTAVASDDGQPCVHPTADQG